MEMLTRLCTNGATHDDVNIQELNNTMDSSWNHTENPAPKFECNSKIEQKLKKIGIPPNLWQLDLIKSAVKCSGTFDATICNWEAGPSDQMFANFCPSLVKESSKETTRKQTAQSFGYDIANNTETTNPLTVDFTNLVLENS